MKVQACPTSLNTEYQQVVDKYGQDMALRVWGSIGNNIADSALVEKVVEKFQSQDKIKQGLLSSDDVKKIVAKLIEPEIELDGKSYKVKATNAIVRNRISNYKKQYEIEIQGYNPSQSASTFYAAKGTALHAYIEEIISTLKSGKVPVLDTITTNVYNKLRLHPDFKDYNRDFYTMTLGQFDTLVQAKRELLEYIRETQKDIDPKGKAEIFTEVPIFDAIHDEAGTIDLLVVFSDGTSSIYDFKSYVGKPNKEPTFNKVEGWEIQMQNYKNMLKRVYGVKGFRESRVLPIQVQYDRYSNATGEMIHIEKGFEKLIIKTKANSNKIKHLDPIPIQELTGNANTDAVLENLYSQIKNKRALQLREKNDKTSNYFKLGREITRLKSAIDEIILHRNANGLIDVVAKLARNIQSRLALPEGDEFAISINEASELANELALYQNLQSLYAQEIVKLPEEERTKITSRLGEMNTVISLTLESLKSKMLESLAPDITKEGNIPGKIGRLFKGISDYNMPVFRELMKLVRYANEATRKETMDDMEIVLKADKAFSEWAKSNGYSPMSKFDLLYDNSTGELVNEYKQEFYTTIRDIRKKVAKKEKLTSEELAFVKNNFDFDAAKHKKDQDASFKSIDRDVFDKTISKEEGDNRKQQYLKNHAVADTQGNFFTSNRFLYDYLIPKNVEQKYLDTRYKFIQANKPVKEYYEMLLSFNERFSSLNGKRISKYFVPEVQQSLLNRVTELGLGAFDNITDTMERAYAIREQDAVMGVRDPVTGEYKKEVPLLFSDPIRKPLNSSQKAEIEKNVELLFTKGTPEFNAEVNRQTAIMEKQEGRKIKSKDLTKSMLLFIKSAHDYENLSNIEGTVKAMKYFVDTNAVAQTQLSGTGKKVVNKFTKDLLKTQKGLTQEVVEVFDDFVDMLVYKRRFKGDYEVGGKSVNKLLSSFTNYLSLKALGLDFVITSANYIQARGGLYIKSKEDIHFGNIELKDTMESFTPRSMRNSPYNMLIDFFQPSTRDLVTEKIDEAAATKSGKLLTERNAFIGYAVGEDNVDNLLTIAMSKRYVIDSDGKIKNPKLHTLLDPNAKSVYDSIEMVNDKPTIVGLSAEAAADFRAKIQKVSYQVKGMTTEETKGLYTRSSILSAMMQFKSWIPGLYQQRLGEFKYDETLESFEQGSFRVAYGEIIGNGLLPSIKNTLKLMGQVAFLRRIEPDSEVAQSQLQQFLIENPDYYGKITLEQLLVMKEAKLRSLVAELRIYLAFALLVQLIGGLEWDDDDENNILTWGADKVIRRALLEVSFWYSPSSVTEIIRSPLPLAGAVVDVAKIFSNGIIELNEDIRGIDNARDKTPYGYYTLKNTPILNQVGEITGFLQPYQRPNTLLEKMFE